MAHQIISGYGSIKKLNKILRTLHPKKILLVTGKASYESCGAAKTIEPLLAEYEVILFSDFARSFAIDDLERGITLFKKHNPDVVIGIGGGSVMDMAKAVAILAPQGRDMLAIIKGDKEGKKRAIPTIMIPTTAGTGSESDRYSVVYINRIKYSLKHPSSIPDHAILDPTFTLKLRPEITAVTGLDALSQAIESYWAVASTQASRKLSLKALSMIVNNIEKTVNNSDKKSREQMLLGANTAGQAIDIASTTAAHAVSYPMTGFFGIPHGQAVALTLPYFFDLNYNVNAYTVQDTRGEAFVKERMWELVSALGVSTGPEAKQKLIKLISTCGLPINLTDLNIDEEGRKIIVEHGFNPDRMSNNPRKITKEDLKKIIEEIR